MENYSLQWKWWSQLHTNRCIIRNYSNQFNGYGTIYVAIPGLQNGSPDGILLVDVNVCCCTILSYEGSFTTAMARRAE
jgi:hypothetical protein